MKALMQAHDQMTSPNLALQTCTVFMDFDGVTHPEPCRDDALFCFLPRIEQVLREFPTVDIVISSSWRLEFTVEQLQGHFSPDIASRVVGMTPSNKQPGANWLPVSSGGHEREGECEAWMRSNRAWGTPWVALDDRAHWFRPDCKDLLLTQSKVGFLETDQDRLRDMLQERM